MTSPPVPPADLLLAAAAKPVKALTVRPPWSLAIADGHKLIENRSWPAPAAYIGKLLLIHAGKSVDRDALHHLGIRTVFATYPKTTKLGDALTPGHIVAVARLAGCHADDGRCTEWAMPGQWHWELADVRKFAEPVPCRGALGLWAPPSDVIAAVAVARAVLGEGEQR